MLGLGFQIGSAAWFQGYWQWIADAGQPTGPQVFALWQEVQSKPSSPAAMLVPGSTVTSSVPFVPGWNFVPLAQPIMLTPGWPYRALTGVTGNFIEQDGFWNAAPFKAGIQSGPLLGYSDIAANGGTAPDPFAWTQSTFQTGSADPTTVFPGQASSSFFCGLDVSVTTKPPAGSSYRMLPSFPEVFHVIVSGVPNSIQVAGFTLGTEFTLSKPCKLSKIWWYSNPGDVDSQVAGLLPASCQIWDVGTQGMVINHATPAWKNPDGSAASPGNRWCYSDFTADNITLAAKHSYRVSVFSPGQIQWRTAPQNFWQAPGFGAPGLGQNGIVNGVLTFPNGAHADVGQITFDGPNNPITYPNSIDGEAENDFVDVEVIPL